MRSILLTSVFFFALQVCFSQRTCTIQQQVINSGVLTETSTSAPAPSIIIIPVVVHILYNHPDQNISNEQVKSQIDVLNQDFRKKNSDAAYIPTAFKDIAGDARIEFRLATIDPSGLPTNGIVRKSTSMNGFGMDDKIKSSVEGGDDPWNRDEYLNIWVGNLSNGVMGYASVPGCLAEKDGVVIRYSVFGTTPNVKSPYNRGRTTVHEVGHWLGLRHIWGDADCGDDRIEDTPPQAGPTRGCPSGVVSTCTSGAAGNMYMNFMDFTNDECTNMFTQGQTNKMRELFNEGGARTALLYSRKAEGAIEESENNLDDVSITGLRVYPNPAVHEVNIQFNSSMSDVSKLTIYNQLGQIQKQISVTKNVMSVNVNDLKSGMYFVSAGKGKLVKLVISN